MEVRYSVVGLGRLGASMAAAIASRGFYVIGVDVNPRAVELVKNRCHPTYFPICFKNIFKSWCHLIHFLVY